MGPCPASPDQARDPRAPDRSVKSRLPRGVAQIRAEGVVGGLNPARMGDVEISGQIRTGRGLINRRLLTERFPQVPMFVYLRGAALNSSRQT
jgi:hypothetical protein